MKTVHLIGICCIWLLVACTPSFAQYSGNTPYAAYRKSGFDIGTTGPNPPRPGSRSQVYFGSISIFPLAAFDTAGIFGGHMGTQTLASGLFALDGGFVDRRSKARYEIGGWYWGRSDADLYELHMRAVSNHGLGFQIGYLNNTIKTVVRPSLQNSLLTDANAIDVFGLYEIHSPNAEGKSYRSHRPWTIQLGVGLFIDFTTHLVGPSLQQTSSATTGNYTFFVSGAIELAPRVNLLASDWIVRDRGEDLNRVTVGLGYSF